MSTAKTENFTRKNIKPICLDMSLNPLVIGLFAYNIQNHKSILDSAIGIVQKISTQRIIELTLNTRISGRIEVIQWLCDRGFITQKVFSENKKDIERYCNEFSHNDVLSYMENRFSCKIIDV